MDSPSNNKAAPATNDSNQRSNRRPAVLEQARQYRFDRRSNCILVSGLVLTFGLMFSRGLLAGALGFVFTILLCLVFLLLATRQTELERRVAQRTADLRAREEKLASTLGALRVSRRRLTILMENLPGMVYQSHDDARRVLSFASEGCEALTGYPRVALENNTALAYGDLIHPADRDRIDRTIREYIAKRQSFQLEYRLNTRSGAEKWVWEQGRGVFDGHTLVSIEGLVTDVSEQKRSELASRELGACLLEARKRESIGILVGGVAHDFNNILMTIMGNAELALMDATLVEQSRFCLGEILEASQRASALCEKMLAFAGKSMVRHVLLDLNVEIRALKSKIRSLAPEAVYVEILTDGSELRMVGDRDQVQQVILNLATNAVEAIGEHEGMVRIATTTLRQENGSRPTSQPGAEPLQPGRYLKLEISDSGCGMDEETLERIFDPFFSTKFTGRGLGLAAVSGIVRSHQGLIEVTSSPDWGSRFVVLFPAVD